MSFWEIKKMRFLLDRAAIRQYKNHSWDHKCKPILFISFEMCILTLSQVGGINIF